jgi:hypothetical protein
MDVKTKYVSFSGKDMKKWTLKRNPDKNIKIGRKNKIFFVFWQRHEKMGVEIKSFSFSDKDLGTK